jgi:hypothetical protein
VVFSASGRPSRKEQLDFLDLRFAQNGLGNDPVALGVRANLLIPWAWDGRGSGYADSVTPEGWRMFEDRLSMARADLQRAWDLDPTDANVCAAMIEACASTGRPSEVWFQRGKKADPTCLDLYRRKAWYLSARWGGSDKALLEFGRECVAEGNWAEQIPFVLAYCYDNMGGSLAEKPDYWAELKPVFERYLQMFPGDNVIRSEYCHHAVEAEKWDTASTLVDQLGKLAVPAAFRGAYEFDLFRISTNGTHSVSSPPK